MNGVLENELLRIEVDPQGAELASLYGKRHGIQYLWQGDGRWWAGRSPVLFPIVGRQINGYHTLDGKKYEMPMHGFAASGRFRAEAQEPGRLAYVLEQTQASLAMYPFRFRLRVAFALRGEALCVDYTVENRSAGPMPYCIGGHTGYNVPLLPGERFEDYSLRFGQVEALMRCPVVDGLVRAPQPLGPPSDELALTPALFERGALVFKQLRSRRVDLVSRKSGRGVSVSFEDFEYLGVWSAPGAPLVCIEPWNGTTSAYGDSQRLEDKECVRVLQPGEAHTDRHCVTFAKEENRGGIMCERRPRKKKLAEKSECSYSNSQML